MIIRKLSLISVLLAAVFLGCLMFVGCSDDTPLENSAGKDPEQRLSERHVAYTFELEDLNGALVSLRDFRGKVVLLNFWATWCAPCLKEMPALEKLYATLKNEGLVVLAVSVDPPQAQGVITRFIRENKLTFPVVLDPGMSVPPQYLVDSYPTSVLIGRRGELLQVMEPGATTKRIRIAGEREWSSKEYKELLRSLLHDPPTPTPTVAVSPAVEPTAEPTPEEEQE